MARTNNLVNYLTDVAQAIKNKKGDQTPIQASQFDTEIANLPSGGTSLKPYNQNDTSTSIPDGGYWSRCIDKLKITNEDLILSKKNGALAFAYFYGSELDLSDFDASNVTTFSNMFHNCNALTTISQIDTSSGTYFSGMFYNCIALTTIPQLNTSRGISFDSMFSNCNALTTIPQLNTSRGISFNSTFNNCIALTTIPELDLSHATNIVNILNSCNGLTNFGGLKNVGQAYLLSASANYKNYTIDLSSCTLLTHDSLMNVINNVYDIATKGVATQKLVLGATNLAKLTAEEIAIATNKGWAVS